MKYRNLGLGVFILGLSLPGGMGKIYKEGQRNIQVANLDATTVINEDMKLIVFRDPNSAFTDYMGCNPDKGTQFTYSADRQWVGCCLPGQTLEGSRETAFDCCGAGHKLVGSKEAGYRCCPSGQEFDGAKCKDPTPVCQNGKLLVDGKCVCPAGTVESSSGGCQTTPISVCPNATACPSEVTAGKCYLFKMDNGEYLGYHNRGWYSASKPSNSFQPGKFKLCKEESCPNGAPVNPGDAIRIQDLHGQANSGRDPNHWLNGAANGGHIAKTPDYSTAGVFTITKWTPGKYCLGGFNSGVGPTCPSDDPAVTFNSLDQQSCVPLELVPVPCDIRDVNNNCLWTGGQKPCPVGHNCVPTVTGPGTGPSTGGPVIPPSVQCPAGSHWNGSNCVGTNPPSVQCPHGSTWNGQSCIGTVVPPTDGGTGTVTPPTGVTATCPPGQSWRSGKCYLPITDCADRTRPEFGDTSYNPADFPCSAGRERPCRGEQVQEWRPAKLDWGGNYQHPNAPKPYDIQVDFNFDVIMSIVDVEAQSEHFLIKLDGEFFGETGGEVGYKNQYVGNYNDPEWCLLNGYTRGYFRIPKGKHTITVEWPKGTGKYKTEAGGNWWYGIARYRFDKLCDPDNCLPSCVKTKRTEAEEARAKLAGAREHTEL
ncbi:hypothetical protein QBC34DRAFT_349222 [Podospora aff. communis PSN243]|uniref:Uncharacterized protein n=1 Tax=Podospora aff. communis PSN243 TaxID=3040156 RepID=A0AAV9GQD9_9PEZI|nr:hypothetical protein QBC34DRAFT_349222 [Podospora aff. communis PSN243]